MSSETDMEPTGVADDEEEEEEEEEPSVKTQQKLEKAKRKREKKERREKKAIKKANKKSRREKRKKADVPQPAEEVEEEEEEEVEAEPTEGGGDEATIEMDSEHCEVNQQSALSFKEHENVECVEEEEEEKNSNDEKELDEDDEEVHSDVNVQKKRDAAEKQQVKQQVLTFIRNQRITVIEDWKMRQKEDDHVGFKLAMQKLKDCNHEMAKLRSSSSSSSLGNNNSQSRGRAIAAKPTMFARTNAYGSMFCINKQEYETMVLQPYAKAVMATDDNNDESLMAGTLVEVRDVVNQGVNLCVKLNYGSFQRLPSMDEIKQHLYIAWFLARECFPDQSNSVEGSRLVVALSNPRAKHSNFENPSNPSRLPMFRVIVHLVWPNITICNIDDLLLFAMTLDARISAESPFWSNCVDRSYIDTGLRQVRLLAIESYKTVSCTRCIKSTKIRGEYESSCDEEEVIEKQHMQKVRDHEILKHKLAHGNVKTYEIDRPKTSSNFSVPESDTEQKLAKATSLAAQSRRAMRIQQGDMNISSDDDDDHSLQTTRKQVCPTCNSTGKILRPFRMHPVFSLITGVETFDPSNTEETKVHIEPEYFNGLKQWEKFKMMSIVSSVPRSKILRDFEEPVDAPSLNDIFAPGLADPHYKNGGGDDDDNKSANVWKSMFMADELKSVQALLKARAKLRTHYRPQDHPELFLVCNKIIRRVGQFTKQLKLNVGISETSYEHEGSEEVEAERVRDSRQNERGLYADVFASFISVDPYKRQNSHFTNVYVFVQGRNAKQCLLDHGCSHSTRVYFSINIASQVVRQECSAPRCKALNEKDRAWANFHKNKKSKKKKNLLPPDLELTDDEKERLASACMVIPRNTTLMTELANTLGISLLLPQAERLTLEVNKKHMPPTTVYEFSRNVWDNKVGAEIPRHLLTKTIQEKYEWLRSRPLTDEYRNLLARLMGRGHVHSEVKEVQVPWHYLDCKVETNRNVLKAEWLEACNNENWDIAYHVPH